MNSHDLMVRQAVRHDVCMRAQMSVPMGSTAQVRLTAAAGAKDGWLEIDLVDFSAAGIGFISTVFVPRKCVVTVRVMSPDPDAPMLVEASYRIQRNVMTDRRPAYLIGASLDAPNEKSVGQIDALLNMLEGLPRA